MKDELEIIKIESREAIKFELVLETNVSKKTDHTPPDFVEQNNLVINIADTPFKNTLKPKINEVVEINPVNFNSEIETEEMKIRLNSMQIKDNLLSIYKNEINLIDLADFDIEYRKNEEILKLKLEKINSNQVF